MARGSAGAGAAPDPVRARAAVAWLADPARAGRGTGLPGNAEAAAWVAEQMREIGLLPAGDGSYRETFEAPFRAALGPGNALALGATAPVLSKGWQPFTFSDDGAVEGELVWAGYGITAPEVGYDDYAGLDVRGKVVLVAQDFPRERDEGSPFRAPDRYRYGEWRYKAMNARDHGAAAVLGVRDAWNHEGADELPPWQGTVSSRAGIAAARVTIATLAAAGVDARALAAPGQQDGAPHSRALGVPVRLATNVVHEQAHTANVVGLLPGSDPVLRGECVVVGAHYDHLGLGGEGSLAPEQTGRVHPGADDNASGTAAMLEIARALAAGPRPRRTVLFAAFGAEELGLLGSAHLVKAPPAACPVERMQLMVNLDMVGRPRAGKVYVEGVDSAKGLRDAVKAAAAKPPALGLKLAFGGDGYGPSDHTSFYARGVPVLFFFTGAHADYHRPTDTVDKIDPEGLAAVATLALRAARAAADAPARYQVVRAAPPKGGEVGREGRGYGAYLGAIPDFAERSEPGVLLTGVRPGSPAEGAGIQGGDVLVRVGAMRIHDLQDLAYALRAHRPGDEVEVEWTRDGKALHAKLTLRDRK
jgi:hypothetical protein